MYLLKPYDDGLSEILNDGTWRTNQRTGKRTKSIFGMIKRYKLDAGAFPLLTRRKIFPKAVFAELLWFISGSTRNDDLKKLGCSFWTPWVSEDFEKKHRYASGAFGPVYGFQLRHFDGYYGNGSEVTDTTWIADQKIERNYGDGGWDQLKWVINRIKEDYSCRRTLWVLWNPKDIEKMRLPPCHMLFQVLVDDERRMTGVLFQRSADYPVGVPANIQFYSSLTIMIAQQTGYTAHEFVQITGDSHIYEDQIDAVNEYLKTPYIRSPILDIEKSQDIDSYTMNSFKLSDFESGPTIKIPISV